MKSSSTKRQIIDAADELFYAQGFGETSFADIAKAVSISRGNFYYHFRTKDEILDAVIAKRLSDRETLLRNWDEMSEDPSGRIACFVRILIVNQTRIIAYGCPVGTLTTELAKLDHAAKDKANRIMALFRDWLTGQFRELGSGADAEAHALHVLSWSQGVATLAQAFKDEAFVAREVDQILAWVDQAAQKSRLSGSPQASS